MEGATRDNDGRAQGYIIIEVIEPISTDDKGHWVSARFVCASDPHMKWWMSEGEGKRLVTRCSYHFCEADCTASRRGASIHVEKFRTLMQKEMDNQGQGGIREGLK